jgi:hypothetical protein
MASIAVALPILPGKTEEWKRLAAELTGPRRPENDDFHKRIGVARTNWYLQQTPHGDIAIVFLEADDPLGVFRQWAESQHPFDLWFKAQEGALYGLDLNQPLPGPGPQMVYEYRAA